MDKYEYRVKTEQMLEYMEQSSFKKAMEIADSIDWRKVKNVPMLCSASEIYEYNGEYQRSRDILFMAYDRSPGSRKIIYRLATLALKLNDIKEATDCYEEFVAAAPKDPNQYILRYKILKLQNAPIKQQIEALEEFKKSEYIEKWAYELARLYDEAGMESECIEECDDLILWFSEGKYVYRAMELKMKYKPLTPFQQEKYLERDGLETDIEETVKETSQEILEISQKIDEGKSEASEEVGEEKSEEPHESEEEKAEVIQEVEEEKSEEVQNVEGEEAETFGEQAQASQAEETDHEGEKETGEVGSILPDDIRQLMEELEVEAARRAKEKMETKEQTEPVFTEKAAEEMPKDKVELEPDNSKEEDFREAEGILGVDKSTVGESMNNFNEIEEADDIKLGDTQTITISAKALMNDMVMEEPVEEQPQKKIATSPFDTGFIVQGRYDLDAQSEIGLRAGLTEEQKKLFSYFVPVRGMSEQIVEVLENDRRCKSRYGTSRTGNILIVGRQGSGKTVLAVDLVKAIQKERNLNQGKVGIVTAESMNKKEAAHIFGKLHGGALIIERASKLSKKKIAELSELMEEQTGELLVVLEEERRPLDKMLAAHPAFKKKFTSRIELPVFINDELVTFGQTYAKENGYKIDDMGILALYSRIDLMQREESIVTVADVKEILDRAIEHAQRASFSRFIKRILKKNKDESERIILQEKDFR